MVFLSHVPSAPKRLSYRATNASALKQRLAKLMRPEVKSRLVQSPIDILASEIGVELPEDMSAPTLKKAIEGKPVDSAVAEILSAKCNIEFVSVERQAGRPKSKTCALEDMRKNGARIGIVPTHSGFTRELLFLAYAGQMVRKLLATHQVGEFKVEMINNRFVSRHLEDGYHLVVGAAESLDRSDNTEIISHILDQRIGILINPNASTSSQTAVLAGSPEEAAIRKLGITSANVLGIAVHDPAESYEELFELAERGQFKAAIANSFAVSNWLAKNTKEPLTITHSFNQAAYGKTLPEIRPEPKPRRGQPTQLKIVQVNDMDAWLRRHCHYDGKESVREICFPLGLAVPRVSLVFNYDRIRDIFTKSIRPEIERLDPPVAPETPLVFQRAAERLRKRKKTPPKDASLD